MAYISLLLYYRVGNTKGLGAMPPPTHTFLRSKTNDKKESFSVETIRRLTDVQNVTVLAILERLEFKNFLVA